jgi:signal transduction histidine kinase
MKKSPPPRMDETGDLARSYARTLEEYLAGGGEGALRRAYEIGRDAIAGGRSLLEIVTVHHTALADVLQRIRASASPEQDLDRAREVLFECLSPYEMAHRGFGEAVQALRRLNETLEHETQRIAHVVHDEAGQLLVAARLAMSGMAQELSPSLQGRLREVGTILDQAEKELRRLSHELRPAILDDLGLAPALQFLAAGVSKGTNLSVQVESSLEGRQAANIETALYRVIREALTNVAKHSGARNVRIRLTSDQKGLHCLVRDDGAGFDVRAVLSTQKGLGLLGIRERLTAVGGTLHIESEPGRGTEVHVSIPTGGLTCQSG